MKQFKIAITEMEPDKNRTPDHVERIIELSDDLAHAEGLWAIFDVLERGGLYAHVFCPTCDRPLT